MGAWGISIITVRRTDNRRLTGSSLVPLKWIKNAQVRLCPDFLHELECNILAAVVATTFMEHRIKPFVPNVPSVAGKVPQKVEISVHHKVVFEVSRHDEVG
jgi:hypothetical protein